ncbi:GGDEF domain-containing protein [Marinobacter caseinilyticus]|uniref:GGDEF domain-containing protein n=1 Tax=Marinobacter caseinilyticus TaxID=2692195 RepID=UPI00140BD55D|nr:GGDEF domain-containing protein [Marinobacter caseinilyticus]
MESSLNKSLCEHDFRRGATFGITLAGLLFLAPFAINNFFQGRVVLGSVALMIIAVLGINAWSIHRGRFLPNLTMLGLTPAIIFFLMVALREQGIIGVLWCYPSVTCFYFMLPERKAWIANAALLITLLPQAWLVVEPEVGVRVIATLLLVNAFSIIFIRVIVDLQEKLHAKAVTDPLTGLLNRTLLDEVLAQSVQQSARTGTPMTLLALDLDRFKQINDNFGHDAGDKVLKGIGELLRKRVRATDKLFRPGGEEFLVLLYDTDKDNGHLFAETLRGAIASFALLDGVAITVSIGVATWQPGESVVMWLKRSDENLYRAKSKGRNQVAA